MKQFSVILIGAGNRGLAYTKVMLRSPEKFQVVAVAEPDEARRKTVQQLCGIPDEMCFADCDAILSCPKMADIALIATQDDQHHDMALKAIDLGYDLLLEKPVARTARDCADVALAAKAKGVKVLVCHVLRYTPFYGKIKELVMEGKVGEIYSIVAVEAVGHRHQSHSFVRGNWHTEETSAPMILAKSCHDLDILQWIIDKPCKKVSSFGDLTYFTPANAPEGAPVRCVDGGCPAADTCHYNCMKLYYEDEKNTWFRGAACRGFAKGSVPTNEEVLEALKNTDYGLCVFHANNDVVDHQVVNMEFEGGATVSFSMNAFNKGGRYIRIFGSEGELYANASDDHITLYSFDDRQLHEFPVLAQGESITSGHGGGDQGIIAEMYEYFSGEYKGFRAADIEISVKNHFIGFAAEKARHNDTVESIDEFFAEYGLKND
ncbi:MAG: Gfo/Idh/MocA family oxidoreductase [Ruminococcaceae bacterium]|nr:Gfo/Idh/MocA family oxidoreductase [Oscillospiraceae bacterium]